MVWAPRVVEAIEVGKRGPHATGAMRPLLLDGPQPGVIWAEALPIEPLPSVGTAPVGADVTKLRERLQRAMTAGAGALRSAASLADTAQVATDLWSAAGFDAKSPRSDAVIWQQPVAGGGFDAPELRNLLVIGHALVHAAAAREETRGAHVRTDFRERRAEFSHRFVLRMP
ncbi:MAG: hypothetical protein ACRDZ8_01535 [Acidimicrobiales bacterium]